MASNPFIWKNNVSLIWKDFPANDLATLRKHVGFPSMGLAICDVSTGNAFGWQKDLIGFAASLTKIAAMYAAFHLQEAVRQAKLTGVSTLDDAQKKLSADWRSTMDSTLAPVKPKKDFPRFTRIFKPSSATYEFSDDFQFNMSEMIGPSHNDNARYCIESLGFDYLLGSLIYGGFYSLTNGRGLWLSGNYDNKSDSKDGAEAPGSESKLKDPSERHQVATADAVTLFMVNLGKKSLISNDASKAMQALMNDSYGIRGLAVPGSAGKLGIQPNYASFSDCTLVNRSCMLYTMVSLFLPNLGTVSKPQVDYPLLSDLDSIATQLFAKSKADCEAAQNAPPQTKTFGNAASQAARSGAAGVVR